MKRKRPEPCAGPSANPAHAGVQLAPPRASARGSPNPAEVVRRAQAVADLIQVAGMACNLSSTGDRVVWAARGAEVAARWPWTGQAAWQLTRENMQQMYEESGWAWRERERRKELMADSSRWIFVGDDVGGRHVAAFANFRFELHNGVNGDGQDLVEPIIYLEELQVAASERRQGHGKRIMWLVLSLGRSLGLTRVLLTVFRCNHVARAFYQQFDASVDATSPTQGSSTYEILTISCNEPKPETGCPRLVLT